ncbi:hypothetical protein C1Y40_04591 [Mycobacterium talmoniae]|uniref:Uncharacterized protein n=1 Tax=Mycobacterium talmoniae TaxID=1858794 RepID=A0A2S8BF07_9MYCO|nr:hypothetical protein C1Y40_04591 [Mycobacterium talmoniae]TDH47946.1 hypothetical protein E2F47_25895 [Mycobacterium eburneum]
MWKIDAGFFPGKRYIGVFRQFFLSDSGCALLVAIAKYDRCGLRSGYQVLEARSELDERRLLVAAGFIASLENFVQGNGNEAANQVVARGLDYRHHTKHVHAKGFLGDLVLRPAILVSVRRV